MSEQTRRRRKRKVSVAKRCVRHGCTRRKASGYPHCSVLCHLVDEQMAGAQRICEALGPGRHSADLWACAVSLSDTWTQMQQLQQRLKAAAHSVGMTDEQWRSLVRGQGSEGTDA